MGTGNFLHVPQKRDTPYYSFLLFITVFIRSTGNLHNNNNNWYKYGGISRIRSQTSSMSRHTKGEISQKGDSALRRHIMSMQTQSGEASPCSSTGLSGSLLLLSSSLLSSWRLVWVFCVPVGQAGRREFDLWTHQIPQSSLQSNLWTHSNGSQGLWAITFPETLDWWPSATPVIYLMHLLIRKYLQECSLPLSGGLRGE